MKNDCYYMHLKKINLFYSYYAYFDVPEFFADQLFIQHQVRVHFFGEYQKKGNSMLLSCAGCEKRMRNGFWKRFANCPEKCYSWAIPTIWRIVPNCVSSLRSSGKAPALHSRLEGLR